MMLFSMISIYSRIQQDDEPCAGCRPNTTGYLLQKIQPYDIPKSLKFLNM